MRGLAGDRKRPSLQENLEDSALYKRRKSKRDTRLRFDVPKKSYESEIPDSITENIMHSPKTVQKEQKTEQASIDIPGIRSNSHINLVLPYESFPNIFLAVFPYKIHLLNHCWARKKRLTI